MDVTGIAASGMLVGAQRVSASAANLANMQSDGVLPGLGDASAPQVYQPERVDQISLGSGGTEAGFLAARKLGWPFCDRRILRMAAENRPYNLAVSLHAATEEERAKLIPANQRWPLTDLMAACRSYNAQTGSRIFFAWTLIDGVNDTPGHARRIAELLHGLDAHINLIPLNRTDGYHGEESTSAAADAFHRILQDAGFPCTIRQRRGIDVAAKQQAAYEELKHG